MEMVEQGQNSDQRSKFAERFDDKLIKRLLENESQGQCLPIDKYDDSWKILHEIAISVDDLLVFSLTAIEPSSNGPLVVQQCKR